MQREDRVASLAGQQLDRGSVLWHIQAWLPPCAPSTCPLLFPQVGGSAFLHASRSHGFRVSSHGVSPKCRTWGPIFISSLFCSPRCTTGHHLAPSPGGCLKMQRSRVGDIAQWETSCLACTKPRVSSLEPPIKGTTQASWLVTAVVFACASVRWQVGSFPLVFWFCNLKTETNSGKQSEPGYGIQRDLPALAQQAACHPEFLWAQRQVLWPAASPHGDAYSSSQG